jgi:hypothetical protein
MIGSFAVDETQFRVRCFEMNLIQFDQGLRQIFQSTESWPFVCDGSPLSCTAFLVGINPRMPVPFWPFWSESFGFHKDDWIEKYRSQTGGKFSNTREYIELLLETLAPIRCLETNLYHNWSPRLKDLPKTDRRTDVFDFLLRTIEPRLLFVHGRPAICYLEKRTACVLKLGQLQQVVLDGRSVSVFPRYHLSFQFGKRQCAILGEQLRDSLSDAGAAIFPSQEC